MIKNRGHRTERMTWYDSYSKTWKYLDNMEYTVLSCRLELPDPVRRRKPAILIPTGRTVTDYRSFSPVVSFRHRNRDYRGPASAVTSMGSTGWSNAFSPSFASADIKLRLKIKDDVANIMVNFAEYKSTRGMFMSLASDVLRTYRSLRKGKGVGKTLKQMCSSNDPRSKQAANAWLQAQFGWLPLMGDLYASAQDLTKQIQVGVKKSSKVTVADSFERIGSSIAYFDGGPYQRTVRTSVDWEGRVKATYRIGARGLHDLARYGITNPLVLGWELIPYSFVVDWLFPVGEWLDSLDALVGIEGLVVARGTMWDEENVFISPYGASVYAFTRKTRHAASSGLSAPFPASLRPRSSIRPILNGLALLRQGR